MEKGLVKMLIYNTADQIAYILPKLSAETNLNKIS